MSSLARGFLFDLNRCTGCNACELACSTENELGWGRSWRHLATFNEARHPGISTFHLSLACNHCAEAPCMSQCPALAIGRDAATGAVLVDAEKCIGCSYCSWVCPYDSPRFDEDAGVMTKCTFCNHRLAVGREPACVESCPTTALRFGPLEGETLVPGFPDTPAQPAIRFVALRQGMRPPASTWTVPEDVLASFAAARSVSTPTISLASEWPLLLFTSIVSALVGWSTAAIGPGVVLQPLVFVAATGVALGTSLLHLGRKARAWRALLNIRRSWLSREVAAFGGFVALSFLHVGLVRSGAQEVAGIATSGAASWSGGAAAALGFACLFCVDRVYDPVRTAWRLHSADTLLTALTWVVLLRGWLPGFLVLATLKLGLYAGRRVMLSRHESERREGKRGGAGSPRARLRSPQPWLQSPWPFLRMGVGVVLPALVWMATPVLRPGLDGFAAPTTMLVAFAIGELIDRAQFYAELEIPTPRRTLAAETAAWQAGAYDPRP
jgi:DMSO reductase iron-sulfur subunit